MGGGGWNVGEWDPLGEVGRAYINNKRVHPCISLGLGAQWRVGAVGRPA